MRVTDKDRRWLTANQPGLRDNSRDDKILITGPIKFFAAYDEVDRRYIINPAETDCQRFICLSDSYELEISGPVEGRDFPEVREVCGRIERVANECGLSVNDLHFNDTGEACLVGPFDTKLDLTLSEFLDGPVLQFFYDQSYFERYGNWPRGQYSHGVIGLFENYYDKLQNGYENLIDVCIRYIDNMKPGELKDRVVAMLRRKRNVWGCDPCLCGSGKAFSVCHKQAFRGIWDFHQRVHRRELIRL